MLKRRLRRSGSGEQGQTLVMVGVVMLVLMGLAAMAIDVGEVLWSRGAEQDAADAAALAGVRQLPANPAAALQVAREYAGQNGFKDGEKGVTVTPSLVIVTLPGGAESLCDPATQQCNGLLVTINRVVPPGLRAAVGAGNMTVPAEAIAVVAQAKPKCGYVPFAIEGNVWLYDDYMQYKATGDSKYAVTIPYDESYGQKVVLKFPQRDEANLLLLNLSNDPSAGDSDYVNWIEHGACMPADLKAKYQGDLGMTMKKAVDDAIQTTVPGYNPKVSSTYRDNVFWQVSSDELETNHGGPGPVDTFHLPGALPYYDPGTGALRDPDTGQLVDGPGGALLTKADGTADTTDIPFGLGTLDIPGLASPSPCSATPNQETRFPKPEVNGIWDQATNTYTSLCPRVALVVIVKDGTVQACKDSKLSPKCPITSADILETAVFYIIGTEQIASKYYPVGAFIQDAEVKGAPNYGSNDLNGPLNYFLWR